MRNFLATLFISLLFITSANSACDDPPGDGVDYSGCAFSDGQDLTGTYLPMQTCHLLDLLKLYLIKAL